jgi:hypothetical protein
MTACLQGAGVHVAALLDGAAWIAETAGRGGDHGRNPLAVTASSRSRRTLGLGHRRAGPAACRPDRRRRASGTPIAALGSREPSASARQPQRRDPEGERLRDLNETLQTLESARGACIASHRDDDAGQLNALAKQIAVLRDRVASDYVPTPPNAPMSRRELDLARPEASEALLTTCTRVARTVRDGAAVPPAELGAAQVALRVVDRDLALQ